MNPNGLALLRQEMTNEQSRRFNSYHPDLCGICLVAAFMVWRGGTLSEEALSFHHQYIGTEHLLLGLLREQEGLAALALAKLGVALDPVRAAVAEKMGRLRAAVAEKMERGDQPVEEEIDYVPRARKVLSLALDEAERQGSAYVRTEHILLGIVRDGGGAGADILDTFGVLGKVRAQVFELLG